jgi:hypothetical protein
MAREREREKSTEAGAIIAVSFLVFPQTFNKQRLGWLLLALCIMELWLVG